jgi:hypothetical protein
MSYIVYKKVKYLIRELRIGNNYMKMILDPSENDVLLFQQSYQEYMIGNTNNPDGFKDTPVTSMIVPIVLEVNDERVEVIKELVIKNLDVDAKKFGLVVVGN